MSTNQIYAIPGFMGTASDWKDLRSNSVVWHDINPYSISAAREGFSNFGKALNASIKTKTNNILLGYSLGGRLGLHALRDNPDFWDGAIFVSTHLGLSSETEKMNRLEADKIWASRFENEEWQELQKSWNSQTVFINDVTPFVRKEVDYQRDLLSDTLRYWSLGLQSNFEEFIQQINKPILWIVGEKDANYGSRASRLALKHTKSKIIVVPSASHRLLWQFPELCKKEFETFLSEFVN